MSTSWVTALGTFIAGVGVGAIAADLLMEKRHREKYEEYAASLSRTISQVSVTNVYKESLNAFVAEMDEIADDMEGWLEENPLIDEHGVVIEGGVIEAKDLDVENDYHKAIRAVETPVELFVEGGVNDYGVSYIEEEEYLEDDGRFKGKIDIIMDADAPIFLMDGHQIDDWDQRLGDSILVDFYRLVPPSVTPVLYVRNHRTQEDYEVVRVAP